MPPPAPAPATSRARFWEKVRLGQLLALLGLTGFAISQPLLSVLGNSPTLFVYSNFDGSAIAVFAVVLALVPPVILWLAVVAIGLVSRRTADIAFVVIAVMLAGCTFVQMFASIGLDNRWVVVVLALLLTSGFAYALTRYAVVREWLRYTAVLPALAVLLFLTASPTADLLEQRRAVSQTAADGSPPVVFIMLDELPTQSLLTEDAGIDRVRFPNLAALADESTWYRNYSVMASWTDVSVPAILSGQEPRSGQALWTSYPDTIFSLFAPTHELTAIESFTELCGYSNCGPEGDRTASDDPRVRHLASRVAEIWRDRVSPGSAGGVDLGEFREDMAGPVPEEPGDLRERDEAIANWRSAIADRPTSAQTFIDSLEPTDDAGLYYLHLMFPHQPWIFGPHGRQYVAGETAAADPSALSSWDRAIEEQQHLWQARYADGVLGDVFQRLRETGLYDDAVVVVTADHGVAFDGGSEDGRLVTRDTITDLAYVPLFVKLPGQTTGRVDDSNLMSIDLLPTVAQAAGVEIPWSVPGHAAGSPEVVARGDQKVIYDFGHDPLRPKLREIVAFDASYAPSASRRLIGPVEEGDLPVTALVARLGLQDALGGSPDELEPTSTERVELASLEVLRQPHEWAPVTALIGGRVLGATQSGQLLMAVNGSVVTAAPVENGRFRTLVPPAAIRRDGNELRFLLLADDDVIELDPQ
jgi:hypothetical protein